MTGPEQSDETAIVVAFLRHYEADVAAHGAPLALAEYQARYPGFEAAIAQQYAALRDGEEPERSAVTLAGEEQRDRDGLATSLRTARYRALDEVARGGMGIIVRVRDERLRRDLAMKVLAEGRGPRTQTDSRSLSRFLDEAHITGQLGHPGIVPVHDLGIDDAGRVFFTMTLIEGRNLAEIIHAVHAGEPSWTLARALGVILRVCEAMAFAHSRGVIHRDLKPGNVMVGAFGETYVLDWGLARVVGAPDAPDVRLRQAGGEDGDDSPLRTMDGDVVGTPAYMAPEQARGEIDQVAERADVYAIGAMIYHLLSGGMPYASSSAARQTSREVLASVREGPPTPIHTLRRDIAPELAAICEKAMHRLPGERYPSVAGLAEDLRAYLELRVVKAYETGAIAELRKWVRRNRALSAMAAVAVLALAAGLGFSLQQKALADTQARHADENFKLARDSVDRMLTHVGQQRLANVPQMEEIRGEILREALAMHQDLLARRREDPAARNEVAWSLLRVARIRSSLGENDEARTAADQAIAAFGALAAQPSASPDTRLGLAEAHDALGITLTNLGEHEAAESTLRAGVAVVDQLLTDHPGNVAAISRNAGLLNNLATSLGRRAAWTEALPIRRQGMALVEQDVAARPGESAPRDGATNAAANLGFTLTSLGEFTEAEEWFQKALRYAEPVSAEHGREARRRHGLAMAWGKLSYVQFRQDKVAEARTSLEAAVAELRTLAADYPHTFAYRREFGATLNNLANVLGAVGDTTAQEAALVEAEREQAAALRMAPDDVISGRFVGQTRRTICQLLLAAGRHADAARRIDEYAGADLAPMPAAEAARFTLQCATVAADDSALTTDDRGRLAEQYTRDAVSRLRAAATTDGSVLDDEEFAPLRDREDFQALVRDVKKD